MKKQHFQKKLALKATRVSNLTAINGGNTPVRFTENPCIISDVETCTTVQEPVKLTEALRCTHTIGNGLNPDGTPCTV
ncbi:hypothetical protein C8N46_10710 [Kordia periserrulae]|uniref:Uncharacterized protein n=1 Tax=Kordia periserrulae TaxID=701523 RepID=A0A2T6BVA3_9FLAO|nr:hypothetical protein [Kordia periserrulae]PTX60004.1 hypothetical protein C8N46_10710 [Kordia periserrulae]